MGIHLLVQAEKRAQTKAHHFVLRHVPTHARRLLRITGLDALLTIE
jgi:anti-anti-sigma regulatory factor